MKYSLSKESSKFHLFFSSNKIFLHNLFISMMEESNPLQPREKTMTYLHRCYSAALQQLKEGRLEQGVEQIESILSHEFMTDTDMENLKYSALMSLANIHEQMQQYRNALGYYWQALQILTNKSVSTIQQGMFNLRKFNEERPHSEFTILLKMLAIAERENMTEQSIYILKRTITLSPSIWRQNLILKLRDIYRKQNKIEALNDLDELVNNKKNLEEILAQNILPDKQKNKGNMEVQTNIESQVKYMKKITLKLNISQKQQHKIKYSLWENLLTMMYVLLKCQAPRCFSKKKYKKLDQSKEWNLLLRDYHPLRTNIEIILVEQEEETENKMQNDNNSEQSNYQIINYLAAQILKAQFIKKKTKKVTNPLEQLTRNPSLNAKDSKKQTSTQTKSIYSSIGEYYKDNFAKSGFKRQLLGNLKFLDETKFNEILGRAYYEVDPMQMAKKDDEMDDEQEDRSVSNPQNKQKTKQKKGPKAKKLQKIAQNEKLGAELVNSYFQKRSLQFTNIYEAVQHVTYFLINNKLDKSISNSPILKNDSIKKTLSKNILKVIQSINGYYSHTIHPSNKSEEKLYFLDLLLEKLQQLTQKDCKNKTFKQYQQGKKQKLIAYIKKNFMISTLQAKQALLRQNLPTEEVNYYSNICLQFVRLNHIYGYVRPSEVSYYRQLYAAFRRKSQMNELQDQEALERRLLDIVDADIEKYQQKISKLKFVAITEEPQAKSTQSVDEIFKKDQQLSSVLPLLKIFSSLNTQSKGTKGSEMVEEMNGLVYLQSFVRLCEIFNKKLEMESTKEFNSRILLLIADLMKIKQVIGDIYQKVMQNNASFKKYELSPELSTSILYHLLRIYLLNLYQENDHCIRIIFYISNIIFRSLSEENKFVVIPKCIILFDELIKYKKFKPELINIIRKKFYQNLILKNLTYIYQSGLFLINQETKIKKKKKKQRKNASKSQSQPQSQKSHQDVHDENLQTKEKVCDILHDIYFCPEKDRQFNPRKIEEAIGYFMYLLKAYHDQFYRPVVQLQYEVNKIIKRCYKIYVERRNELFEYCERFKSFKGLFETVMNGDESSNFKYHLVNIIKGEQKICECCSNLREKHPYCIQSLFLLGKFFESQTLKDDITIDRQQWLEDLDKDEIYYFQYLSMNMDKEIAWQNLIRINANKSYMYFDSLIVEPFENYKGKFLYTKKIIQYVSDHLQHFRKVIDYGNQKAEILNAIKLKERQYFALLKEIEVEQAPRDSKEYRQYKDLYKKYKEGVRKIEQAQQKITFDDVKMRYLRVIETKMKLFWINLENEGKQEKKKEVIQLDIDDYLDSQLTCSKVIKQIAEILAQIKSIINDLPQQQKTDYVIHLQQDLVVEAYTFLCKNIDQTLDKLICSICETFNATTQDARSKTLKQTEDIFNDLKAIVGFFSQNLLVVNQKYKLKYSNLVLEKNQIDETMSLLESIFTKNNKGQIRNDARAKLLEKSKQKKQLIVINDDDKNIKQDEPVLQIPIKKSAQENQSPKQAAKNKDIVIDVSRYVTQKIKKQINRAYTRNLFKLKNLVVSQAFSESMVKISKIMSQLVKFYQQLPKFQTMKRYKNRRSVGNGLLQSSLLVLKYAQLPQKANEIIKDLYNFKSDELVLINIYNDKISAQKNQLLSEYYNRVLVHQTMKVRFIQHLFKIYEAQGNKENLIILTRKLLRLSKGTEKQSPKDKEKQKLKQKQKLKPAKEVIEIDEQVKEVQDNVEGKQEIQPKQTTKQKKAKGVKQKQEKQQQIKCYYLLYCQATSTFINILRSEVQKEPVNEKYERNILEFRQKIKKNINKNETNFYLKKIEDFIEFYERKFNKKIKMKRTKAQMDTQKPKQQLFKPLIQPLIQQIQIEQPQIVIQQPFIVIEHKGEPIQQNSLGKLKRKISRKKQFDNSISKAKPNPIKKQKKIRKKQTGQAKSDEKVDQQPKDPKIARKPRKPRKKKQPEAEPIVLKLSDVKSDE